MLFVIALLGCKPADPVDEGPPKAIAGTTLQMDFARDELYDAPWPSEDLLEVNGTVRASGFPNPRDVGLVDQSLAMLDDLEGFSTTAAIYFRTDAPLGELPSYAASLEEGAQLFLVEIGGDHERVPVEALWHEDGGPYGADNLLSVMPFQGWAMKPGTLYAAVVLRGLGDAAGDPLGVHLTLRELVEDHAPDELSPHVTKAFESYREAIADLGAQGLDPDELAGLAVFRTQDPTAGFLRFVDHGRTVEPPALVDAPTLVAVWDDYCEYQGLITVPDYQGGTPPYSSVGGQWPREPGEPRRPSSRLVITVPRMKAPEGGFPTMVMVRTGGGGDNPLVGRGIRDAEGEVMVPGTGPASWVAPAGWAGAQIDGVLGGPHRNPSGADEQFLMFNIGNAGALRDNVRQSALEIALLPELLAELEVDASDCPGVDAKVGLDGGRLALLGHSMGATIAPLAALGAPAYRHLILSGAGSSYIENLVWKAKPLEVRPLAEALLGYSAEGRRLESWDPVLSLLQWPGESADPPPYAMALSQRSDLDVLMIQGVVDRYQMPPMANATSVPLGLDLAGEARDALSPELEGFVLAEEALGLRGGVTVALPAGPNRGADSRLLVQLDEDGVEDGHEVMYQHPYGHDLVRCFLATADEGPVVIDPSSPCP